jgi:hypothetical protein
MANFAVLHGNTVHNIIVAESKEIAEEVTNFECVECSAGVGIGMTYDKDKNEFVTPVGETTTNA